MNNLSWFLYLIQVADNFQGALSGVIIAGGAALFFGAIAFAISFDGGLFGEESATSYRRTYRRAFIPYVAVILIYIITPSRQTLLLIAGSEIGERVVASDQVTSVVNPGLDLLKSWISKETARLNAPEKNGGDK